MLQSPKLQTLRPITISCQVTDTISIALEVDEAHQDEVRASTTIQKSSLECTGSVRAVDPS